MTGKLERECATIRIMVAIYCDRFHRQAGVLCSECRDIADYAVECVSRCHFGEDKPACGLCRSNCFREDRFERISSIMRYAGPRMLYRHPLLAFRHLLDAVKARR